VINGLNPAGRQLGQPGGRNIRVEKQARTAYAKATRALNHAVATDFLTHIFGQATHGLSTNVDHYLSDHGVLVFKPNGQWVVYFVLNEFKAIYCLEDRQVPLVNSPPPGSLAR
jgi:hypothetical protein